MPRGRAANGSGLQPRKRADGRWECRFQVGINPSTGKAKYKCIYGKTAQECVQKLRAATAAVDAGTYHEPQRMTLRDWLDIWYKEYCVHIKASSKDNYDKQIRLYIVPALGGTRLCNLQIHHIQTFINDLSRGKYSESPLSPKSVRSAHGVLHSALKQATKLGYLVKNPSDDCKLPRVERKVLTPMKDADIAAFLKAIEGHPNGCAMVIDLFTGLRKSELVGLTWDCVDFKAGSIHVYRQLQVLHGEYSFQPLKNDKDRTLFPAEYVMNMLKKHRQHQLEVQVKAGEFWNNPDNFIFTNEVGRHILHQTIYKQFIRIADNIGIPQMRFHDLRHSFAVASLKHGDDVKTVQENLGHATAAFTLDVYGHATDEMKRASGKRMDAAILQITNTAV
ncbi:MAG: site-specific integrase [Clostridiales bacterium]|nr:site-specific integrase [Clostridiales bacterium]